MNIKKVGNIFPLLGLALLLLLSPCSVRNHIQSELGIPQTNVSNKNKSTIATSNCSSYEITTSSLDNTGSSFQEPNTATENKLFSALIEFDFSAKLINTPTDRSQSVSPIPLYILYQNLKVYL